MKKTFLAIIFPLLFSGQKCFAQSTTILPDRLTVPNVTSLGTCNVIAKGSTVFNTTDNKMYYCNGTNWQEMTGGGFTLPYSGTQNLPSTNALFHIKNTSTNSSTYSIAGEAISGTGLLGISNTGSGVYGYSNSSAIGVFGMSKENTGVKGVSEFGTGGYFESDEANALEIKGKMRINGTQGIGGAQLIVPSNGNNPIWQDPISFAAKDLGASDFEVVSGTDTKLPYTIEDFDLGTDFSTVHSEFTAPVRGIYHFDAMIMWKAHTNGVGIVAITLKINGGVHSSIRTPAITGKEISNMLSQDLFLNANDKVAIYAYQTSGADQLVIENPFFSRFSGHLVNRQ